MFVSAIVLAAGKGRRLGSGVPKPLVKINSRPLIIYSLLALSRHALIDEIILVVRPANKKALIKAIKQYRIGKISSITDGGRRRQDSVYCGLKKISRRAGFVLVHDGARPFAAQEQIDALLKQAQKSRAAVLGVPVKATIKEGQGSRVKGKRQYLVKKTLERSRLWEIQTPQVFARELMVKAYRRFGRGEATDDAALVEKSGAKVAIVPGSYRNIKITTPEDLIIATAIINADYRR